MRSIFHPSRIVSDALSRNFRRSPSPEPDRHPDVVRQVVQGGRPRKWIPRPVSEDDHRAAETFKQQFLPSEASAGRVQANIALVAEMSGLSFDKVLWPLVGQMINSGLAFGTIHQYLLLAKPLFRTVGQYRRAIRAAALAHAESDSGHANDVSGRVLDDIIVGAPKEHQVFLYVMRICGARVHDLARLKGSQIFLDVDSRVLHIQFRATKNRRTRGKRFCGKFFMAWAAAPSMDIVRSLLSLPKGICPFRRYNTSVVNTALRNITAKKGYPKVTSYSFRRSFMNKVFRDIPPSERQAFTLHLCASTLFAHYQRWIGEDEENYVEQQDVDDAAWVTDDDDN